MKTKLNTAYMNKERAAQIAEKEAVRFETMVRTLSFRWALKNYFYAPKYSELHLPQFWPVLYLPIRSF